MNKDFKARERLIFNDEYNALNYLGGIRRFKCSTDKLRTLYAEDFVEANDRQNDSPSLEEFLEYVGDYPTATFECYAVCPEREDYRVTVEGVNLVIPETDYDAVGYFAETFHYADEFSLEHVGHNYHMRAWWD